MKHLSIPKVHLSLFVLFLMAYASISYGQQTIQAQDIVDALKAGQDVSYENVTVTGIMDLTAYAEKAATLPKRKGYNGNEVENHIKGNIRFKNCRFDDHVYAYFNDDNISHTKGNSKYTFITNFRGDVIFEDCEFEKRAWFKYSDFSEKAVFTGTSFNGSSTFKYAEFPEYADFAGTTFDDDNTFKYAKFWESVSFADSKFNEDAIFKYTKFKDGVTFKNSIFDEDLDFKYTEIRGDFVDDNMQVSGEANTKYMKVNGKKFSHWN